MVLFIMLSYMGNIFMQLVAEQLLHGKLQYYRLLQVHVLPPPHTTNFHGTVTWHFYFLYRAWCAEVVAMQQLLCCKLCENVAVLFGPQVSLALTFDTNR